MRGQSRIVFRAVFRIKVSDRATGELVGYVGDISERGLRVLSDTPAVAGTTIQWRLRMRRDDGFQSVDIDGHCLWSRQNARSGQRESGIRVDQPNEAFVQLVESLRARRKAKQPA
ncbi:PilZ domain-containing protein [Halopseudomonas xinjiangensis]|uniref:PilZ domain-containing protein n=1 Tax=Halopseudomonas xinjiangensis TaxID=487184 RepID=A0A1H1YNG4_9GAMM|nr:PilZ domain-containing protein [Halopseudomonas xinjiangensis]SDT23008.1 PilZ domain-containing protein [Halopseudomonas xinjiangensis]